MPHIHFIFKRYSSVLVLSKNTTTLCPTQSNPRVVRLRSQSLSGVNFSIFPWKITIFTTVLKSAVSLTTQGLKQVGHSVVLFPRVGRENSRFFHGISSRLPQILHRLNTTRAYISQGLQAFLAYRLSRALECANYPAVDGNHYGSSDYNNKVYIHRIAERSHAR